MGEQHRWFKLWYSAGSDDHLAALPPALRWAWAMLGAHTKTHGTHGVVQISQHNAALAGMMGVSPQDLIPTIQKLPHIHVGEGHNRNGEVTVTWKNWIYYQEDSTVAERQKSWRERHRNGLRGDKNKKREEKEENHESGAEKIQLQTDGSWKNLSPEKLEYWRKTYPGVNVEVECRKAAAYIVANPKKKKSNYERYLVNWLSRVQDRGGSQAPTLVPDVPRKPRFQ